MLILTSVQGGRSPATFGTDPAVAAALCLAAHDPCAYSAATELSQAFATYISAASGVVWPKALAPAAAKLAKALPHATAAAAVCEWIGAAATSERSTALQQAVSSIALSQLIHDQVRHLEMRC